MARRHRPGPGGDALRFPEGFVWGSGVSAHQVEGGNTGNDWSAFEGAGGVSGGVRSGDACDHFSRYEADFDLAAALGHAAFKTSVEWSRVEPEEGCFDAGALAHYAAYVKALLDRGIEPWIVLHHFTSPRWLAGHGWWLGAETPRLFARFARVVAERLSPHVRMWVTINEPMLLASAGYVFGVWPPERRNLADGLRVASNLVRAHRLAYGALRAVCGPEARIGPAVNVTALKHPGNPTARDRLLGGPLDWLANHYFTDRVADAADFLGVQYYSRATVQQLLAGDPLAIPTGVRRLPRTDLGWEIYPRGIYHVVKAAWRRHRLPIYVTENGLADASDRVRGPFIRDHLVWLHRAIAEGCDVRGYLHWSLLDNFEWREGFAPRFGLVAVDYATQERTVRPSARYYERICRANAVEPGEVVV